MMNVRSLSEKELNELHDRIHDEFNRRERIEELVHDINDKMHELMGELTGNDELYAMNNLTGEIVTTLTDWDEPEGTDYLSPKLVYARKGG